MLDLRANEWHPINVAETIGFRTPCPADGPTPSALTSAALAGNTLQRGVLWALPIGLSFWAVLAAAIWAL